MPEIYISRNNPILVGIYGHKNIIQSDFKTKISYYDVNDFLYYIYNQ